MWTSIPASYLKLFLYRYRCSGYSIRPPRHPSVVYTPGIYELRKRKRSSGFRSYDPREGQKNTRKIRLLEVTKESPLERS